MEGVRAKLGLWLRDGCLQFGKDSVMRDRTGDPRPISDIDIGQWSVFAADTFDEGAAGRERRIFVLRDGDFFSFTTVRHLSLGGVRSAGFHTALHNCLVGR